MSSYVSGHKAAGHLEAAEYTQPPPWQTANWLQWTSGLLPYSHCKLSLGQTEPAFGAMIGQEIGAPPSDALPLDPLAPLPLAPLPLDPLAPLPLAPLPLDPLAPLPLAPLDEPALDPVAPPSLVPLCEPLPEAPEVAPLDAAAPLVPLPESPATENACPPHAPSAAISDPISQKP
jgi:hypothetical protein